MGQVNCCRGARDEPEPEQPRVPSAGSGQLADGGTRSRRRRWLPWHFVRPGTSAAAEAPGPSGSTRMGLLFGRPLADLCSQDGMLPQPMQDLLALLHEQGPSTEGIFRLAASERASREIREALDSGTEVHLASQPVHIPAVILKVTQLVEFLVNHHEELFEDEEDEKEEEEEEVLFMEKEEEGQEKEEGAGLAGEGAEESPAPGEQGETAEVPAVAAESAAQNSSSGQSSLPGSLQEGQNPSPRKRKLLCEEGDDGQPSKRRRRLEPDSS
nr:myelin transcription factor 1-like [Columba livia]